MDNEPILSVDCEEDGEIITRHVYPMMFNIANLERFWKNAQKFRVLFTEEIDSFNDFCNIFLARQGDKVFSRGLFWVVDDFVGIFYLTDITPPTNAYAHFTWFDRKLNGRQELTRKMMEHVVSTYGLNRISVQVPVYAVRGVFSFIKQVGFKPEGRMKYTHPFRGRLYDSLNFGYINPTVLEEQKNGQQD